MTELKQASTAYRRMTEPDQQVIAAAIRMMLTVYAGLRIPQLDAPPKPDDTRKEETHNADQ
jgi:hypothetical protein